MNIQKVISELQEKYPGKKIFKNNEDNPTEILCELDPSSDHPEYSNAVAVIDKSAVHYHKKTTETYKVIKGELKLFLNGKMKLLKKYIKKLELTHFIIW